MTFTLQLIILLLSFIFFFPKEVGGNLCGPVCPPQGLHYFEQECFGLKIRTKVIDAYWDNCYGLPIEEKRCYGVPYTEYPKIADKVIDCNYV